MPEAIVKALVYNRVTDETVNSGESILHRLVTADIVRFISERVWIEDGEGNGIDFGFSVADVLSLGTEVNRVLGVAEDFIVKVISETINMSETVSRVIGIPLGFDLVKPVNEIFRFNETLLRSLTKARIRTDRTQISESIDPNKTFFKVVSEVLNITTSTNHLLVVTELELVRVISDVFNIKDSQAFSVVTSIGSARVINESVTIVTASLSIAAQVAQLIHDLTVSAVFTMSVWFNRDSEQ